MELEVLKYPCQSSNYPRLYVPSFSVKTGQALRSLNQDLFEKKGLDGGSGLFPEVMFPDRMIRNGIPIPIGR